MIRADLTLAFITGTASWGVVSSLRRFGYTHPFVEFVLLISLTVIMTHEKNKAVEFYVKKGKEANSNEQ